MFRSLLVFPAVLLGTFVTAASLTAADLETEIRRQEFVPFIEQLIEKNPTLKALMTPGVRAEFSGTLEPFRSRKLSGLSSQIVTSEFYQFSFFTVEFDDRALLVNISAGKNGAAYEVFGLHINAFPGDADLFVKNNYTILPDAAAPAIVQEIEKRLTDVVAAKNFGKFDDFERELARKAGAIPRYIRERIDSKNEESVAKDNTLIQTFKFGTKVRYVGTKSVTDKVYASLFIAETSFAPAVFMVTYVMHEGKPLIASLSSTLGTEALNFYPEIKKAFPGEKQNPPNESK
jgi:hypothetical protein